MQINSMGVCSIDTSLSGVTHAVPLVWLQLVTVTVQDPWRCGSGPNSSFAGAAALLQLRLLQAYLLLPKASAFAPEHASLLRLCASAFKGTSAASGASPSCDKPSDQVVSCGYSVFFLHTLCLTDVVAECTVCH